MDLYLLFASAGAICITLGGIALHLETKKRIEELESDSIKYRAIITQQQKDIRVLKEREAQKSDKIYIVPGDSSTGGC